MGKMSKDTAKMVEELALCDDFKTFYDANRDYMVTDTLIEMLRNLQKEKGLRKSDIIRRAEISEVYAYQIFAGTRHPERKKLLCLAIGLTLNLEETQTLIKCAGYAPLYVKQPFDSVVMYGICNKQTVGQINELLFEYKLETLG
jgi:transcriptional regulator with XRE-family HTH domain